MKGGGTVDHLVLQVHPLLVRRLHPPRRGHLRLVHQAVHLLRHRHQELLNLGDGKLSQQKERAPRPNLCPDQGLLIIS